MHKDFLYTDFVSRRWRMAFREFRNSAYGFLSWKGWSLPVDPLKWIDTFPEMVHNETHYLPMFILNDVDLSG